MTTVFPLLSENPSLPSCDNKYPKDTSKTAPSATITIVLEPPFERNPFFIYIINHYYFQKIIVILMMRYATDW
jgi:hypothetical protein